MTPVLPSVLYFDDHDSSGNTSPPPSLAPRLFSFAENHLSVMGAESDFTAMVLRRASWECLKGAPFLVCGPGAETLITLCAEKETNGCHA